jgi:hypothetical protein
MKKPAKVDTRVGVLVRMPPELKAAVVAAVEKSGTNMNDVCVSVIADKYGMNYEPTERHGNPRGADKVLLRMDDKLKRKVQTDAFKKRTNTNDTIVRVLAEAFGVNVVIPEGRRATPFGGGPKTTAVQTPV